MAKNQLNQNNKDALSWLRTSVFNIKTLNKKGKDADYLTFLKDPKANLRTKLIGQVLLFRYKPESRTKIYDKFPLVLVLFYKKGGFVGINLHYIPPKDRLKLILLMNNVILKLTTKDRQKTRIKILSILNKKIFSKYKNVLINNYNTKNIMGKAKVTTPEEWTIFAFLPVFKGINPSKLYSEIIKETQINATRPKNN